MSVAMAVEKLCGQSSKNHLYFHYGGGTKIRRETLPLIAGATALARRHPRLQFHVDAHTGRGAPLGIAKSCAVKRSFAVMDALMANGVNKDRLSFRAWGKQISMRWSEPEDDAAARAELFFHFEGKEFPRRARYYRLVPEAEKPIGGHLHQLDEGLGGGRPSDQEGTFQRGRQFVGRVLLALLARLLEAKSALVGYLSRASPPQEG